MDYYAAMEEAMIDAADRALLPTDLTREQMLTAIDDITRILKTSGVRNDERIILHAQRQEFRLRLLRAEQVARRLMGPPTLLGAQVNGSGLWEYTYRHFDGREETTTEKLH